MMKKLDDDTALVSPRELLRLFRTHTFDAGKEMRKLADQVGDVKCGKACDNCCHQKVLSTPAEGLAIYLLLRQEGRWSRELEARLDVEDRYATRTSHDEWFKERRPCLFLKNGECSVYAVRPVGCLSTFSTNDPKFCGDSRPPPGTGQMQIDAPTAPAMWRLGTLLVALERGIPGAGYMTLPGAVLAAARFAEKREIRRALVQPIGPNAGDLIQKFDEAGKTFDFDGGRSPS